MNPSNENPEAFNIASKVMMKVLENKIK